MLRVLIVMSLLVLSVTGAQAADNSGNEMLGVQARTHSKRDIWGGQTSGSAHRPVCDHRVLLHGNYRHTNGSVPNSDPRAQVLRTEGSLLHSRLADCHFIH